MMRRPSQRENRLPLRGTDAPISGMISRCVVTLFYSRLPDEPL
jgi:hypothetical protein